MCKIISKCVNDFKKMILRLIFLKNYKKNNLKKSNFQYLHYNFAQNNWFEFF